MTSRSPFIASLPWEPPLREVCGGARKARRSRGEAASGERFNRRRPERTRRASPQASRTKPCAQSAHRPHCVATPSVDLEVCERACAERNGAAHLVVGDRVADADVHGPLRYRCRRCRAAHPREADASANRSHYHPIRSATQVPHPSGEAGRRIGPADRAYQLFPPGRRYTAPHVRGPTMSLPLLSLLETRVLGVLVEKQQHRSRYLSADAQRARRRLHAEDQPRSGDRGERRDRCRQPSTTCAALAGRRVERRPGDALFAERRARAGRSRPSRSRCSRR